MNRKFRIILTLSLLLNVLCVGLLVGYGASRAHHQGLRGPERTLAQFAEQLPAEKRAFVEERLAARKAQREIERVQKNTAHQALLAVVGAPEFSAEAFDAKAGALHAEYAKRAQEMSWMLKDIAQNLSAQERAELAKMLERKKRDHVK